jgi:hypothetical protein
MKYIITESRLESLIFKYLDNKLNGIELKKGRYSDIVFAFPNEQYGLLGYMNYGHLYIFLDLRNDIKSFFSITSDEAEDLIGKYVESKFNLMVKYKSVAFHSDWAELKVKKV